MEQSSFAGYSLSRLAVIEAHRKEGGEEWPAAKDDLDGLIEEVFVWARTKVNFGIISDKLAARRALDFESLDAMRSILVEIDFPVHVTLGQNVISPSEVAAELTLHLHEVKSQFANLSEIEVDTKVSFLVGGNARQLVFAAAVSGKKIPALVQLVRNKIALLAPIQVRVIWSWVQEELDPASLTPISDQSALLPPGWAQFTDVDAVRDKLARYVVELKPALLAEMARRGQTSFPMKVPDTSQILSWKEATAVERMSEQEGILVTTIGRIGPLLKALFARDESDVAMGLGLDPQSRIFKKERSIFESNRKQPPPFAAMCYELRKFIQVAEFMISKEVPLEAVLRQLKLGLEVVAQDISREYAKRPELRLQRDIARFLIERGIYAVGTKFGRSETDFVIGEHSDHYVIEVKKYARGAAITDRTVKSALVQLQSYMDQPPTHPLGILVVVNFTDSLLIAPPTWIRGRYKILVINLQQEPPSGRRKSLSVEEGSGAQTIDVHVIDGSTSESRRKRGGNARSRRQRSVGSQQGPS
jgi:hypothetical protein